MRPTLKAPHWPVSSVVTLQEHNGRNAKEYNFFARRSRLAKKLVIIEKQLKSNTVQGLFLFVSNNTDTVNPRCRSTIAGPDSNLSFNLIT